MAGFELAAPDFANSQNLFSSSLHDHLMLCALQIKYMCMSQLTQFHVSKRRGFYIFKFHEPLSEKVTNLRD